MNELSPEVFKLLTPCKDMESYTKNIAVLSNNKYVQDLYKKAHYENMDDFFGSTENIPRILESYLVIDFEQKRTLICDLLFSIHLQFPQIFTLEKYLYATKRIFWLVTQYRWSKEDISFILKTIPLYLKMHVKDISQDAIMTILSRFQEYGPWQESDLVSFFDDRVCTTILQENAENTVTIYQTQSQSSPLKRILVKFGLIRENV